VRLPYKVLQHLLGDREIRDDAVFQGPDGCDVARRAAEHVFGVGANRLNDPAAPAGVLANSDDRGFVEHDAVAPRVNQSVGGSKVDRQVIGEITMFLNMVERCPKRD
jgi:hypothetical protein